MDNNNFTQNNFNQLNNSDSYNNQQPTNPGAEQPQVFSQSVPEQPIIPQQPNIQPQTIQQPPIVSQQPVMQPQIMQQPIIHPTATELQSSPDVVLVRIFGTNINAETIPTITKIPSPINKPILLFLTGAVCSSVAVG